MPITKETLKSANDKMQGNTNRGILFTTVNLANDAPRLSTYLSDMAAGLYTWDQFHNLVQRKLTVKSFPEFLDKFQPAFYYRLSPGKASISVELGEDAAGDNAQDGADAEEKEQSGGTAEEGGDEIAASASTEDEEEAGEDDFALAKALPEYEFSLEGGPASLGWKRVAITLDHPLFKSLAMHLKDKALTAKTTANVDVDDALFGFKPPAMEAQLRKSASDFHSATKKLTLEIKRNVDSPDTAKAMNDYDRRLIELQNAIGDDLRVLPTITSGLAKARKAMGADGASGATNMGGFMLELRGRAGVVATPQLPAQMLKALPDAASAEQAALGAGKNNKPVLLETALEERGIASVRRADGGIDLAKIEVENVRSIVKRPDEEQYPALVGALMNDMIKKQKIQPLIGNMLAVVLQNPQQLAEWNLMPKEIEVLHDTFLGIYSMAVENFIRAVVPMFETLIGIYALFNEFPYDVRKGQPELIVANDDLTFLWQTYTDEIASFLRFSCHQAANQYRDAVSFAIVPGVSPLKSKSPSAPPNGYIRAGQFLEDVSRKQEAPVNTDASELSAAFDDVRNRRAKEAPGFGKVAGASETMGLMQLGEECGFAVLFSPEEKVIAGRVTPAAIEILQDNYCPDSVVDRSWAVSGMLCLPDFVCLPPDGMLFTGAVMDGRSVGVEVPEITIRSCYVAAGRFMANDNPEVLKSSINKLPLDQKKLLKVRSGLPGLSLDLTTYPVLGMTHLAPDHFLNDHILRTLNGRSNSFLVFSHVFGQSPNISAPRTLYRVRTDAGERYVLLHHWRQQTYLRRLLYAAYHIGHAGAWPTLDQMSDLMDKIVNWMQWYDKQREGYVNAFPGELQDDIIEVQPITEGDEIVSFIFNMKLKSAVIGPLELLIEN